MRPRVPELLLIVYLLLPFRFGPVVAQLLVCHLKAIHAARQAEKKFILDLENDTDEALKEFLASFWLNPDNASAYVYLGLIAPYFGLVSHPIRDIRRKVLKHKIEYSKFALDQSIAHHIEPGEIESVLSNGTLIRDRTNEGDDSNHLVFGLTQAQRPLHVKCSYQHRPLLKVMAVLEPELVEEMTT